MASTTMACLFYGGYTAMLPTVVGDVFGTERWAMLGVGVAGGGFGVGWVLGVRTFFSPDFVGLLVSFCVRVSRSNTRTRMLSRVHVHHQHHHHHLPPSRRVSYIFPRIFSMLNIASTLGGTSLSLWRGYANERACEQLTALIRSVRRCLRALDIR